MKEDKTFLGIKLSHLAIAFCLLFVANTAITGLPPTTLQGLWDTVKTTTFNFFAPNYQITTVTGGRLIETGNKNILKNADFENSASAAANFTCSTVTPGLETTVLMSGKQSIVLSPSAQTFECYQDATLYASNFQGSTQLLAMVWIRTNQSGIKVCSRNDGVTSTTNCVTVSPQSPSVWQLIKVPFISSSTSNGISIAASSSITGNVYIDDAFVGAVDLKTDIAGPSNGSVTTAGATNCSWSGSTVLSGTTLASFAADADCGVATATGIATAPATKIPAITLPAGTGPIIDFRLNGTFRTDKATATNAACYWELYDGTNQYPLNLPAVAGASGNQALSVNQMGTRIVLSSPLSTAKTYEVRYASNASPGSCSIPTDSATISNFQIAVTSYPSSGTQLYSASCGANCVDTFSAKVSSTGVVSGENIDWINGSASISDTSIFGITFNSGIFTVSPNCEVTTNTGTVSAIGNLDGAATSSAVSVRTVNSPSTKAAYGFEIFCQKTGADFTATRTITGSFAEVMTVPGVSKPKTCYYAFGGASATLAAPTVCAASPCIEVFDSCGTASPPTRSGAGLYLDLTFASGTFSPSTFVKCTCTAYSGAATNADRKCGLTLQTGDQTWQTNASGGLVLNMETRDGANADTDTNNVIDCAGFAP